MEDSRETNRAIIAHLAPFGLWWVCKYFLNVPEISGAWQYAVRSAACLVCFLYFRPWRWYPPLRLRNVPLGAGVGVLIFLVWVGPESRTFEHVAPPLFRLYHHFFVGVLWMRREVPAVPPYSPSVCGWPLALTRLAGSAFVIAFIEEFVFRGFLYRWAIHPQNFLKVDPGTVNGLWFMLVALTFAFEHNEWLAGIICGIAYGWLFIQSRDIWAAGIAHMVTNFLLGLYVLHSGLWQLW